jgi:glucose-6-phosphate dehydrogenase assembly protein OpcA
MNVEQVERELARLRINEGGTLEPRSSVLNLVVVAEESSAREVLPRLSRLAAGMPSRTIALIPGTAEGEAALDVRPTAFCYAGEGSGHVCTEQIEVRASGPPARHLQSLAAPLLLPDLPTFLYLPCDFTRRQAELESLAPLAERLVLDSRLPADAGSAFGSIAGILSGPGSPAIGDLQWTTLTPWRSLFAEMFSVGDRERELSRIRQVEISHSPAGKAQALLLLGWLASSLGWRQVSKYGGEIELSSPSGTVEATLSSSSEEVPLQRARIYGEELSFQVSCDWELSATRATVSDGERRVGERTIHLATSDPVGLLEEELRFRGRDETYENALRAAVELLAP